MISTGIWPQQNIFWKEAIAQGMNIERYGMAYIANKANKKFMVYWHGNESRESVSKIEEYIAGQK